MIRAWMSLPAAFLLLATCAAAAGPIPAPGMVTDRPVEIHDVLYNPGMGFADFHFGWGNSPPPEEYPRQTVAYFRWTWDELEPSEGRYNFALVDNTIRQAQRKGETLAFRIMSVYKGSTPRWLLDKGVDSVRVGGDVFPDHNNPIFLDYHERLLRAFGDRYAGRPEVDHVDIGSVGCWGEWNTACCGKAESTCRKFYPDPARQRVVADWYFRYFPGTPLVMLAGGPVEYAASKGAGWRGDCFGDYGMFGPRWNHMVNVYEPISRNPAIAEAWKTAPVQFEVCGVIQDWYDRGFDIDRILQKGLAWHVTLLNAKSSPVPANWRGKIDDFLRQMGYRFVLREVTHAAEVGRGEPLAVRSLWENRGVAPIYRSWPLLYRLRAGDGTIAAVWRSRADLRKWLPGPHEEQDVLTIPDDIRPQPYALDVAIQTGVASRRVKLAIAGRLADDWYAVSQVDVMAGRLP